MTLSSMKRDYYEVLGLSRDADSDAVKRAYRKIALECHPDRNPDDPEAEDRFKEATEAYEVLRDPEQRAIYDRYGHDGLKARVGSAGGFAGFRTFDEALNIFMHEFGGFGFQDFFGGERQRRTRTRGADLKIRIPITFEEVDSGVKKTLRLPVLDLCPDCHGTGGRGGAQPATCSQCHGSGEVRQVQRSLFGQFVRVAPCSTCRGEGKVIRDPCPECDGEGRQRLEKTIELEIPPGVDTDDYLTLRGQGNIGPRGGPRGDVLVVVEVQPDERFQRRGADLVYDLPLTFSRAALGTTVEIPTVSKSTKVKIPSGMQTGHVIRLRGKGLPRLRGGGRGDVLVRLAVMTPKRLTAEQRKLFEKLAESEKQPVQDGARFWQKVREAFSL